MHVSISVRDAFADRLRPNVAAVAGRVHAGRTMPFSKRQVPAIVVDVPSTMPRTDGKLNTPVGMQRRQLSVPVTIIIVDDEEADIQAALYALAADVEAVLADPRDLGVDVADFELASIGDPSIFPSVSEDGLLAGLTLRFTVTVVTRQGAPNKSLMRS